MKSLQESLLDNDDELFSKTGAKAIQKEDKQEILNFVLDNYKCSKTKLKISKNPPYVVNYISDKTIELSKNTSSLTNGMFTWGEVEGDFDCSAGKSLTTLKGAPEEIERIFNCDHCKNLKFLEGTPKKVWDRFICGGCENLKSLKGAPEETTRFYCMHCNNLTSLKYAPKKCKVFICSDCNNLKTLKYAPENVESYFDCRCCGIKFTEDNVKKYSNIKGDIKC